MIQRQIAIHRWIAAEVAPYVPLEFLNRRLVLSLFGVPLRTKDGFLDTPLYLSWRETQSLRLPINCICSA